MNLALGTVQFGLAYGIAGSGSAVPEVEVRRILRTAWQQGVRTLDTAALYGDIEQRLAGLCGGLPFRVVSKVGAVPAELPAAAAADWAEAQAKQSRQRLGSMLSGLMCHRADDLLGERGDAIHSRLQAFCQGTSMRFGASCYDPDMAQRLYRERAIGLAQLPGNALDQRLALALPRAPEGLEIHLRSVFLQGLLLMPEDGAAVRLPAAAAAVRRWHAWCRARGLAPLRAALSVVKSFGAVSTVVVGVESLMQIEAIAEAWQQARPSAAPELAESAGDIIDPRLWNS